MFDNFDLSAYPSFEVKPPKSGASFKLPATNSKSYDLSAFGELRQNFVAAASAKRSAGSIDSQPLSSGSSSSVSPTPLISSVGDPLEPYAIDAEVICPQSGRRPLFRLKRDEFLTFVRQELYCTLGSSPTGMTLNVLTSYFSEDAKEDLAQIAKMLGFCSVNEMLRSEEFADIVEPTTVDHVLGAANTPHAFCYKVVEVPRTRHIIKILKDRVSINEAKERARLAVLTSPANNVAVLEGKLRLLRLAAKLGAETRGVYYGDIQTEYALEHGVPLDKAELKRHFQCGRIKEIVNNFLFDDVRLLEDSKRTGSLHVELKRPINDIIADAQKIAVEREALKGPSTNNSAKAENVSSLSQTEQKAQPEVAQPTRKQKKYEPELVPLTRPSQFLFTDDLRVREKYTAVQKFADNFDAALAASRLGQCEGSMIEPPVKWDSPSVPLRNDTILSNGGHMAESSCNYAVANPLEYGNDVAEQDALLRLDLMNSPSYYPDHASVNDRLVDSHRAPSEISRSVEISGQWSPAGSVKMAPCRTPSPAKSYTESAFAGRSQETTRTVQSNGTAVNVLDVRETQSYNDGDFNRVKDPPKTAPQTLDVEKYYRVFSDCLNRYTETGRRLPAADRNTQPAQFAKPRSIEQSNLPELQTEKHQYNSKQKFNNRRKMVSGQPNLTSREPRTTRAQRLHDDLNSVVPKTITTIMKEWSGSKKCGDKPSLSSQVTAPKKSLAELFNKIESLDFDTSSIASSSTLTAQNNKRRIYVPMAKSSHRPIFANSTGCSSVVALPTSRGLRPEAIGSAPTTSKSSAHADALLSQTKAQEMVFYSLPTAAALYQAGVKPKPPSLLDIAVNENSLFVNKKSDASFVNDRNQLESPSAALAPPATSEVEKLRSSIALVMSRRNVTTMKAVEMNVALQEYLGNRPFGGLHHLINFVRKHVDFIEIRTLPTSELVFERESS